MSFSRLRIDPEASEECSETGQISGRHLDGTLLKVHVQNPFDKLNGSNVALVREHPTVVHDPGQGTIVVTR